ncbi:MAG TPA: acetate--CoA ligase [Gammaproteobacteria bacterium]|nr:acetate--CoA ligase [Gammaproteobacteria bacterium]
MSYPVISETRSAAWINEAQYNELYARSLRDPENFWSEQAEKFITWFKRWENVLTGDFKKQNVRWFDKGKLNACYNALDRHLENKSQQTALIWESDDPLKSKKMTYSELHEEVCRFANVLKKINIKKGDRVCIYMPMVPEAVVAMLACARIGAVHSVVFAGFSPESLSARILDANCQLVITADEGMRGNKIIPLKNNVDQALEKCADVRHVIVIKNTDKKISWKENRDLWYHDMMKTTSKSCPCEMMDADDPLFILYTSGSTGKPKGILHTTGGYLVYVAMTFKYIFDYHDKDVYWCTADIGWITGHSYLIYGPLCNGAISLLFEGVPNYPTPARFWEIIDKHQVNIFYTAPTAIRALRREGDAWVTRTSRKSLKLLGTVGEPINPDVWEWYYQVVGNANCPIVDTWWQTETGGILLSPLPGVTALKPGSVAKPFFGIVPEIVDDQGQKIEEGKIGKLIISQPWPGMMQTVYGDRERFITTYFTEFPGCYLTGDNAKCDADGYFWVTGRNDDVIKISGHRIGTGEVESAFLESASVAEAGVVSVPDDIKGESIYAFVTLKSDIKPSDELKKELIQQVRKSIGAIATPKYIQWAEALPKTRSGKIMRRLLRKIANNEMKELGDVSTLADPQVIDQLIKNRIDWQKLTPAEAANSSKN